MSVYEQLEDLIISIKKAKEDIIGTDLTELDKEQLNQLANECLSLLPICNQTIKEIDKYYEEE